LSFCPLAVDLSLGPSLAQAGFSHANFSSPSATSLMLVMGVCRLVVSFPVFFNPGPFFAQSGFDLMGEKNKKQICVGLVSAAKDKWRKIMGEIRC